MSVAVFVEPHFGWKVCPLASTELRQGKLLEGIDEVNDGALADTTATRHEDLIRRLCEIPCYGEHLFRKVSTNFDFDSTQD